MTITTLKPSKTKLTESQKKIRDARSKAWRLENPDRHKDNVLKWKYGISLAEWNDIFVSQGSSCAICRTETPTTRQGWVTDHCHSSGKVRGILCNACNVMVGMSSDNPATLQAAIKYLGH